MKNISVNFNKKMSDWIFVDGCLICDFKDDLDEAKYSKQKFFSIDEPVVFKRKAFDEELQGKFTINKKNLDKIKWVLDGSSFDPLRLNICSVAFDIQDDCVKMVSTNGHILSMVEYLKNNVDYDFFENGLYNVNNILIEFITKEAKNYDIELQFYKTYASVVINGVVYTSYYQSVSFPDYKKIIPFGNQSFESDLSISKDVDCQKKIIDLKNKDRENKEINLEVVNGKTNIVNKGVVIASSGVDCGISSFNQKFTYDYIKHALSLSKSIARFSFDEINAPLKITYDNVLCLVCPRLD